MRVTVPGSGDLEVSPGTRAATVLAAAGLAAGWCGTVRLDPDHPAGVAPLTHGSTITAEPRPLLVAAPAAEGLRLRVVEGPDAGSSVPVGRAGVVLGRGAQCELRIRDPATSERHALVTPVADARAVRVRDLGSSNGVRRDRRRRLRPGETFVVGRSRVLVEGGPGEPDGGSDTSRGSPPWAAIAAGGATGVALAAATGRWYLALIALAAPLAMVAPRALARWWPRSAWAQWSPPPGPIAIRGEDEWVAGYVRAVLTARGRGPQEAAWTERWTRWLPGPGADDALVAVRTEHEAPSWCASVVDVGPEGRVERCGDAEHAGLPLAVSEDVAEALARARAGRAGPPALPPRVRWSELERIPPPEEGAGPRRVRVAVGATAEGTAQIDLDDDGPHLLIAGTTGAGKSVLLETLVSGLAWQHAPADLAVAMIDFKGGASLDACAGLPHVVGMLTDLEGGLAGRVIDALSCELADRKRALRERGLASWSAWEAKSGAPPRLLIVVDEFQEVVARNPRFMPDLVRLAAQGRSLGLHLVLATQRPAGAVTPEIRANVSSTVALRVASAAESHDLLGRADAAQLPSSNPGRGILARGAALTTIQVATPDAAPLPPVTRVGQTPPPSEHLAVAAARRWRSSSTHAPLWLPPLPERWEAPAHTPLAAGLGDWPRERRQHPIAWEPEAGPAVVVGGPRSGRSGALRSVAAGASARGLVPVWLPRDPRLAARTLHLAAARPEVLLLIDDAERALARLEHVDDGAAVENLLARTRLGLPTAIACAPHAPARLAGGASVCAILPGVDDHARASWGAPRDLKPTATVPGRAVLRDSTGWCEAQLPWTASAGGVDLVQLLPDPAPHGWWASAGDGGLELAAPTGEVVLVGAPGPERDRIAASMPHARVSPCEAVHLVPPGQDTVVVTAPTPRALRMLAPRDWQGVAPAAPAPHCGAVVRDGGAVAVRWASD